MKTKILLLIIGFAVLILISFLYIKNKPAPQNQDTLPVLFYSDSCVHCKELAEFIDQNKIKEKISFLEKEVSTDKNNAAELFNDVQKCGLAANTVGVPFYFDSGKCYVGKQDIVAYFSKLSGISQANQATPSGGAAL